MPGKITINVKIPVGRFNLCQKCQKEQINRIKNDLIEHTKKVCKKQLEQAGVCDHGLD